MEADFEVKTLGECTLKSPIQLGNEKGDGIYNYINDSERIVYDKSLESFTKYKNEGILPLSFEKAGPRERFSLTREKQKQPS